MKTSVRAGMHFQRSCQHDVSGCILLKSDRDRRIHPWPSLFLILGLAIASSPGSLAQEVSSITVISDNNYAPYIFIGTNGLLQGIIVDQWKAWELETGIEVTIRGMPWAEALNIFNNGVGDILDTVFITDERLKLYEFSRPYARIKVPVFIHRSISGIASVDDLRGFNVAVKSGDAAVSEFMSHGITNLALYPSYESIIEAAANNDVRIFCVDEPPALYYLFKLGIEKNFRVAFILNEGEFHRAVRRGDGEVLRLVERGFASIPKSLFTDIDRKWHGSSLASRSDPRLVGIILAVILGLFLVLVSISWELRRRVSRATESLQEKLVQLEASEAKNRAFLTLLPDLIFTLDREGVFIETSTTKTENLAFPPESFLGKRIAEVGFPESIVAGFMEKLGEALGTMKNTIFEYQLPGDQCMLDFEGRIVPFSDRKALLVVRDITDKRKQENLLRVSLLEKDVLLKEIHHRVKNNMQVISSLIQLQSYSIRDEVDREMLQDTQARIRAMAAIHELLYQSHNLSSVDVAEYLGSLIRELSAGHNAGGISCTSESFSLSLDDAMPLGLIANELLLNAIKYAYPPGEQGRIEVDLRIDGSDSVLLVRDYGRGLPPGQDPEKYETMGFTLIRSLVSQLKGTITFGGPPGFSVELRFKPMGLASAG